MPASGNANSVNSTITITSGKTGYKNYYTYKFTPSVSGVYKFTLNGSGGNVYFQDGGTWAAGGAGGQTIGYLYLSANSTVYVGCGSGVGGAFEWRDHLRGFDAALPWFVDWGGEAGCG